MFNMIVVDDERHLVDSMADTIPWEEYGIQYAYKAYSAEEALETIKIQQVNIVVTDIRMPGMNGMEFISRLSEHYPHIEIIILSGYADFTYAQTAVRHNVTEYLLKPVSDEEITNAVLKVSARLHTERENYRSRQRQQQLLNQNLPLMRSNLLYDLLNGKRMDTSALEDIQETYDIHICKGDAVYLLLIRMEGKLIQYDYSDQSLMVFSIFNMLHELFGHHFHIWNNKEIHDYLVVLLNPKKEHGLQEAEARQMIVQKAGMLQNAVHFYLQGSISVLVSSSFCFPEGLQTVYRKCLARFRNQVGEIEGMLISDEEIDSDRKEVKSLQRLYEPLTIAQLMDLGKWTQAKEKLDDIIAELRTKWPDSREHLLEVYYALAHSFLQFVHGNSFYWDEFKDGALEQIEKDVPIRSVRQLECWSERMLHKLEKIAEANCQDGRSQLVKLVNYYIETHLGEDVSLQNIADHVRFNPAYLSKIYKLETGVGVSEYSHRLRMDKAIHLLKQPKFKIYEISVMLGYQNPQYFSKLFKKEYGCTPQEFRDKLQ